MEQTLVDTAIHPADDSIKKEDHQSECKDHLIINIPEPKEPPLWPECCIYRVPKRLRELRKRSYTPRQVSIGPFHYCKRKDQTFKDMEDQKVRYFWYFCKRTGKSNKDELARIIQHNEEKIRQCYSEDFRLGLKEFVEMILLDAVFILELFCRKYEKDSGSSKARDQLDYILIRPCMERGILHDLLLLENQIPFFVLEVLYTSLLKNYQIWKEEKPTLIKLSCGFFVDLIYYGWKPGSKERENDVKQPFINYLKKYFYPGQQKPSSPKPEKEVKHLTDLVRYFFCPPKTEQHISKPKCHTDTCTVSCACTCCDKDKNKRNNKHLHGTATKLDEVGLKFKKSNSKRDLLQIQFPDNECLETFPCFNLSWLLSCLPCLKSIDCLERSVQRRLEVPPLLLDDKTEGLFRNLMALEQCHYPSKTFICDYIVLLDDLITTKEDVRLLVEKEIIVNELGSSAAVTKLINNLALEIEESGNPD